MARVEWTKKIYKPHRIDCGCNRCFKRIVRENKLGRKIKRNENVSNLAYYDYINSPNWLRRKEQYYKKHKKQCQACGSCYNINLHHMVYGEFGNEPDYTLVCLCDLCHNEYHATHKGKKNTIKRTQLYIAKKQARLKEFIHSYKVLTHKSK